MRSYTTSQSGLTMKVLLLIVAASLISSAYAAAPDASDPSPCGEIRAQIQGQTGNLSSPNTALLQKIGTSTQCRFTSAEVYRAAYGDKPMVKRDHSSQHRQKHDEND
jgi:hypothetical protein